MLSPAELEELELRISANADKLIRVNAKKLMPPRSEDAPGTKPLVIDNLIQPEILEVLHAGEENWPLWVDDVVQGVARLDWYRQGSRSVPLSGKNILRCFGYLATIDAYQISHLLNTGERQARRYLKACELLHDKLVDGFCNDNIRCTKYPDVFVYPKDRFVPTTDLME